jgi:hypothetical protein
MERSAEAIAHEEGLARFIAPEWRPRFRESLGSSRRRKMLARLYHFRHLDQRFVTPVAVPDQFSAYLAPELRRRGAPTTVYIVSTDHEIDGRSMTLSEALAEIPDRFGSAPAFISCIPGKLAYFHEEEYDNRYILQRDD